MPVGEKHVLLREVLEHLVGIPVYRIIARVCLGVCLHRKATHYHEKKSHSKQDASYSGMGEALGDGRQNDETL